MYYKNNIIHVYDSSNSKIPQNQHKIYINRFLGLHSNLKIAFKKVQSQNYIYDCSIFAIASVVFILYESYIIICSLAFDIPGGNY